MPCQSHLERATGSDRQTGVSERSGGAGACCQSSSTAPATFLPNLLFNCSLPSLTAALSWFWQPISCSCAGGHVWNQSFFLTNSDSALIISYICEHVRFETKTKLCELQKRDHLSDLSGHLKISIFSFSPMMIVPSHWTQGSPRMGKAISPNKRRDQCKGSF